MRSIYYFQLAVALVSSSLCLVQAQSDSVEFSRPTFKIWQEVTHIVKGGNYIKTDGLDDAWIEPTNGSVDFQIHKNRNLGLDLMISGTYFSAPYHYDQPQNYTRNISVTLPRVDANYLVGDADHPLLRIDMGIFNYKYNDNVRNLGEYMFRTWAYPGLILTGGLYNYLGVNSATLTGFKFGQNLGNFSHDLLVTVETDLPPVYDLNLTYMLKFKVGDIFKMGAGVQFARVMSADDNPLMTVHYFEHNGVWYAETPAYYSSLTKGISDKLALPTATHADSVTLNPKLDQAKLATAILDSVNTGVINPDLKRLTARAIKPVFYFSFDPKPLLNENVFGPKDLILYGELAILGVENYPVFYNDIMKRIPSMIGFNFPTFYLLDVLSVEVEYYGSQMLPAFKLNQPNAAPGPATNLDSYYPADWDKDNLKWSITAERTLIPGIVISGQLASDHARSWDWNFYGKTPWEIYTTPSQWYWGLKLTASI